MSTEVFYDSSSSEVKNLDNQTSTRESNKRLREDSDMSSVDSSELVVMAGEIKQLKVQMSDVVNSVAKMSSSIEQVLSKLGSQENRFKEINKKLDKQNSELIESRKVIDRVEGKMKTMEKKIRDLEWKVIDQEARSRRNNLLFFGVPEQEGESCSDRIQGLIRTEMGITDRKPVLQRAHRLGPVRHGRIGQKSTKPRPIIVNFLDHTDREAVRAARFKLRPPMGVNEDFPVEVRKARESLLPELRELKNRNKRATIAYPARLISEGQVVKEVNVLDFAT